jgi:fucokinase
MAHAADTLTPARLFALREAIARTGETFAEQRAGVGPGAATPPWDAVVLTCATESQAAAAREELGRRHAQGLFPDGCTLLALPDPPSGRVGSGGATLLALEALATRWLAESGSGVAAAADLFRERRVLLVHSGGESQRLPMYAALGKIFAPLPVLLPEAAPRAGGPGGAGATIFDWLYLLASTLPGAPGEVTLLSGDVMPVLNPLRLERERYAVRGVAIPVPAAQGQQFGVYVPDADGAARRILQKPTPDALRAAGAVDEDGRVAVDTGIVTLRAPALEGLLRAAGLAARGAAMRRSGSALLPVAGGAAPWDLYRDWLPHLARERAGGSDGGALPAAVAHALAQATETLVAGVAYAQDGAFVHLGTSRDFHDAVSSGSLLRRLFPFTSQRESVVLGGTQVEAAFVGRSLLGSQVRLARGSVVDHCRAVGALVLGEGAMASGLDVPAGARLAVAAGRLCYQTLVRSQPGARRVTVVLGIDDNPKLPAGEATFNGLPLADWMAARGVTAADLWPEGKAGLLWDARLFPADEDDREFVVLDWLQDSAAARTTRGPARDTLANWRALQRHSLHELLDSADAEAIAAWREALVAEVAAARVEADVAGGGDESFAGLTHTLSPGQRHGAVQRLRALAEDVRRPALERARYWRVLADMAPPGGGGGANSASDAGSTRVDLEDRAAAAVREAVSRPAGGSGRPLQLREGRRVRVAAPVRVDFGGGWTDTPPFSLERGGAVLNAALTLDGELPLWAEAEALPDPEIVLEAADLVATARVRRAEDVAGHADPSDPFALHKACLVLAGLVDPRAPDPLAALRAAGAGVRLRTGGRIPRGSGLGTSSIIGAAAMRALGELLGAPQDDAELSRQTLELEQLMTTGGGWQDQMGAIAPGLKLVSTEPGMDQRPVVEQIHFTPEQRALFESHLVVAYTGHHRLAKNILRQVVMRYLGRDPLAMQALSQLRTVAGQLARAARDLNFELFGTLVNQAWLLNKTLDPQTSFPAVERLFSALAPHAYGAKLVGAGGGGFLVAVTRRPDAGDLVADLLARDREFAYAYVVPHRLWTGGLQVESSVTAEGAQRGTAGA